MKGAASQWIDCVYCNKEKIRKGYLQKLQNFSLSRISIYIAKVDRISIK